MRRPIVSTVVFDLDDTLYDCYRQRVRHAHRRTCRILLKQGLRRRRGRQPTVESLYRLRRRLFREDPDFETLDLRLCRSLGLGDAEARRWVRAGRAAYFSLPVGPLHLFSDTPSTLRRLRRLGVRVFVVTAGNRAIQRAKVRRLGLDRNPDIRKILYTGMMAGRGKKDMLRTIAAAAPSRRQVLVVGDRPDSEIRAANQLGLWTARRIGGEFARRRPRGRVERPDFEISRISQIFTLPLEFSGGTTKR